MYMKNSQKGFAPLILLVIIAVVGVGGGAYYYSEKKEQKTVEPVPVTTVETVASTTVKAKENVASKPKSPEVKKQATTTIKIQNDKVSVTATYTPPKPTVPTPSSPTVNGWKTHANADYSLTFSYPAHIKTSFGVNKRTDYANGEYGIGGGGGFINTASSSQIISIVVYERHPKDTTWRIDEFKSPIKPEKPITVGNVSGKLQYDSFTPKKYILSEDKTSYTTVNGEAEFQVRFISDEINRNGKRYRILAMVKPAQATDWQTTEEFLKSILATFKFTN